jgi:hypothetical protein
MDEAAVKAWYCHKHHGGRGRGFSDNDVVIETALMIKGIFSLSLRVLEGFLNSLFMLINIPLTSPDYTYISKRASMAAKNAAHGANCTL